MVTHKTDILCFLKIYFNIYQVHPVNVYWPFIEYLMKIFLSKYLNKNMRRQLILNTGGWFIKIFNSASFIITGLLINLSYGFQSFSSVFQFKMMNMQLQLVAGIPPTHPPHFSDSISITGVYQINSIFIVLYSKTFKQQKNQILMEISKNSPTHVWSWRRSPYLCSVYDNL